MRPHTAKPLVLLSAVIVALGVLLFPGSPPAGAEHCPKPFEPSECHTPPPTPRPTPAPTAPPPPPPTAAPTPPPTARPADPTQAPRRTRAPSRTARPTARPDTATTDTDDDDLEGTPGPEETPLDLDLEPIESPRFVVEGPVFDETPEPAELNAELAQDSDSGSGWTGFFLFLFGFLLGGLVGRASWGFRRKKKQQLFG